MTANTGLFNQRFAQNFLPKPASNTLEVGTVPPDFELPRVGGGLVKLSDYRGKQPVVLAFTRIFTEKLFCPLCYPHIQDLKARYAEIQALGAELLMVTSTDPVQSAEIAQDLQLPYPLLFDPSCEVFQVYGVGQALGAPLPGQFVLDQDGKLRYKHLFSFLDPNASTDEVIKVLREGLQTGWDGTVQKTPIPFF
jgi:peroxiredoxin